MAKPSACRFLSASSTPIPITDGTTTEPAPPASTSMVMVEPEPVVAPPFGDCPVIVPAGLLVPTTKTRATARPALLSAAVPSGAASPTTSGTCVGVGAGAVGAVGGG